MFDEVSYRTTTNSFFFNLQVLPREGVEVYGNLFYNTGTASVFDLALDSSALIRQPGGMDYDLFNEVVPGFSDLDVDRVSLVLGTNYQFTDRWLIHGMAGYDDFGDNDPYLFDSNGRRFYIQLGATVIF